MISIFYKKNETESLEKLTSFATHTWVSLEEPTNTELHQVAEHFSLDESILQDALDVNELPRVDVEDGVLYIFTRFVFGHGTHITSSPIMIALKESNLITISPKPFPRLERFLNGKVAFSTSNPALLLVKILRQVSFTHTASLNTLGKRIFSISKNVEKIRNKDIVQFVSYENILNDINSALVRNDTIYRNILSGRVLKLSEDDQDIIEDLTLENGQNMQIAKDNIRNLVNIREAYSTILTNNLNYVIKLFTTLTIVLTIPTILGTLYGMNVPLPFQENPYAFLGIILFSVVIVTGLLFIFRRKDWI